MEKQLSWLGGLWDGEGSIIVWHSKRETGKDRYIATLVLTNTNVNIISESVKILDKVGIKMHLSFIKRIGKYKDCYQLTSRNMNSVKKFCETMIPYLVGKKPQAELTLRFVNSRLDKLSNSKGWGHNTPYSEDEISLCEQLMKLNKKGKDESSTTIRSNP